MGLKNGLQLIFQYCHTVATGFDINQSFVFGRTGFVIKFQRPRPDVEANKKQENKEEEEVVVEEEEMGFHYEKEMRLKDF